MTTQFLLKVSYFGAFEDMKWLNRSEQLSTEDIFVLIGNLARM